MNCFRFPLASLLVLFGCLITLAPLPCTASSLDFNTAYQQLLSNSYQIKAANVEVESKEADIWQAGTYPNPALGMNFSSIGRDQDGDENQIYVGFTQLIEFGGKRAARVRVASASQCTSEWNVEIAKNELYARLLHSFISMASAQERTLLASGQQKIAEETLNAISMKAASGNSAGIDEKKAEVAFRSAQLEYLTQCSALRKTKKQLLSLWNSTPPFFDTVDFPLYDILPPPTLESLVCSLKSNPELVKAEAEAAFAAEIITLERSRGIPDVGFQIGVTTERFVHVPALTVGFNIPLPIFDRNEGNISKASYEQLQAVYNQMDLENELKSSLEITYHDWVSAFQQAVALKNSILPAAESAFQLAQSGYDEGKFDYLELLDARSTLFDVQQQYLDAVEEYNHKKTEILKITKNS